MQSDAMDITARLIEFALGPHQPPQAVRQIVQLSAVDWAACGIAGVADGAFDRWARQQGGTGTAGTFAGRCLGEAEAALVNGTLSHALDFDDTHFAHIGHPSVVMFPAVMALAPKDWDSMERAVLVGIEAQIRIGLWLGRDHYQRGFHQTATAGALGACVGLITLRGLEPDRAAAALGLCATMASGLKAQFGTMGKPLNAGLAARAAVEAVRWAEGGMTGPPDGIEAFGAAHGAAFDVTALDGLGVQWHIETLSHKFHACCHGLHATLEALRS
ncbi:MmgE/PrpD family protein, partial [Pseudooctadecabacter sp.]|uniref:MmgE/PrpD family protein n=1 Tax=Pseudooctadecabacter sp. TaxID=1966338 RepID=UPI0025E4EEEF